jgi:hypothetical protein
MDINIKANCGNSPKNEFLKELNIAFARSEVDQVMHSVTDDIELNMVGSQLIKGKEALKAMFKQQQEVVIESISLQSIITHGKEGAVNGEFTMSDGKHYAFADFYQFETAKAKKVCKITSYLIEIN